MIFERITEPGLSQYAYAIGCRGAKEIAIVDPMRDIDVYLDFAGSHGGSATGATSMTIGSTVALTTRTATDDGSGGLSHFSPDSPGTLMSVPVRAPLSMLPPITCNSDTEIRIQNLHR